MQVEKVLDQCNPTIDPNVYHYYVAIEQFNDLQDHSIQRASEEKKWNSGWDTHGLIGSNVDEHITSL